MTRTTAFAGHRVPAIGLGTWNVGDSAAAHDEEIAALRAGLDAGLSVIDTAEMYGSGRSEELVGEALRGRRDDAVLVSAAGELADVEQSIGADLPPTDTPLRTARDKP